MKPQYVYLDSNVVIAICDGNDDDLRHRVDESVGFGTHLYPFSADQVSEVVCSADADQNRRRLEYLERISGALYFADSVTHFGFHSATPQSVYDTLNEVVINPSPEQIFSELISHGQQLQARQEFQLDPKYLNNLDPPGAIVAINNALRKRADGTGAPASLAELTALVRGQVIESFTGLWHRLGQSENDALRSFEVVTLFSMLDSFGYWPDDAKTYAKGSRFTDSRHAFSASYFDVFVSNDKRLRNRALAVYEVLGITTKVIPASDFLQTARG